MVMTDTNFFFGFIKSITSAVSDRALKIEVVNKAEELFPDYKFCKQEICNALECAKAYIQDGETKKNAVHEAVTEMYKKPKLESQDLTDSSDDVYMRFWGKIFTGFAIFIIAVAILLLAFYISLHKHQSIFSYYLFCFVFCYHYLNPQFVLENG